MKKQQSCHSLQGSNVKDKLKIDLIVIGNPNSGKTSLIKRFIQGQTSFSHFYTPTLGLSLQRKTIILQQKQITICIWDTAGQQKFFSLTKNYFKKADGILIIFDLTDRNSFQRIEKYWINQVIQKSDENCTAILIGNKSDLNLQRVITKQQIQELQKKIEIKYFQTSARNGENVQQAIQYMVKECMNKVKDSQPRGVQIEVRKNKNQQGKLKGCMGGVKEVFTGVWEKFKQ